MRALVMAAAASLALASAPSNFAAPPSGEGPEWVPGLRYRSKPRRGKGQNNRRGNGLCAKPKKRPNRLTISKRVRRKHRRSR
jgi:hypothetical protein